MKSLILEDFRCFRERQEARLAPLTLLVGENSTGKTSFLAMARILQQMASSGGIADFKQEPYDLGVFDEIAHYRGGKGGRAKRFTGGFLTNGGRPTSSPASFEVSFRKLGPAPVPERVRLEAGQTWCEFEYTSAPGTITLGSANGRWTQPLPEGFWEPSRSLFPIWMMPHVLDEDRWVAETGAARPAAEALALMARRLRFRPGVRGSQRLVAGAPVRSRPRRTYDPARTEPDPHGDYVPMLFADLRARFPDEWDALKNGLESFGRKAGLFDEIQVKQLGIPGAGPFHVQVRKLVNDRIKGPYRNLVDVGYGVSQILPVFTELLRGRRPAVHLIQQPEVHLHPSAQAALGSLLCDTASWDRQLIVETHSQYLLDRVRMDVRDGRGRLKPTDISILFFDRTGMDVKIHSIRIDRQGNVLDAPPSYGRFFMKEVTRSISARAAELEI